jgi:hypothetical protein
MIWIWINQFIATLLWYVAPPTPLHRLPKIDPNAPCPSCGHTNGRLQAVTTQQGMFVQHTCSVCHAVWNEAPVVKTKYVTTADKTKAA